MHAKEDWECSLEIPVDYSLDEFHKAILSAVNFDDDHMYEFSVGQTFYSRNNQRFEGDNDEVIEITISQIIQLIKGKKLFYMFDYGDSWLFQISKSRKKCFAEDPDVFYPRVTQEKGIKPVQYPDYDEEW